MQKYFVAGLLFLVPLIYHSQMGLIINPFVYSQIAVVLLSLAFVLIGTDLPLTVRLFYIWCFVATFHSEIPQFSAIALIGITLFILLYKFILKLSKSDLEYCFEIIALTCAVQVFWIFAQVLNKDFIMNLGRPQALTYGSMGNHNILGAFFLFSIIPMYKYKKWSIILPIIGIFYSHPGSSIYALLGGVLFYFLFSQKFTMKTKLILVGIMLIATVLSFKVDNPIYKAGNGRFPVWKQIIKKTTEENMIVGHGLGLFRFEVWTKDGAVYDNKTTKIQWPQAHNVYIQAWRELGIDGMIIMIMIPLAMFINFLRNRTEKTLLWMSGVVMICLNAFGNFPDRNYTLALLIVFVFACSRVFGSKESLFS